MINSNWANMPPGIYQFIEELENMRIIIRNNRRYLNDSNYYDLDMLIRSTVQKLTLEITKPCNSP